MINPGVQNPHWDPKNVDRRSFQRRKQKRKKLKNEQRKGEKVAKGTNLDRMDLFFIAKTFNSGHFHSFDVAERNETRIHSFVTENRVRKSNKREG
jgi:hypothetical protein